MQPSPQISTSAAPSSADELNEARRTENLTYQVVTIAAILVVLGSLWVF